MVHRQIICYDVMYTYLCYNSTSSKAILLICDFDKINNFYFLIHHLYFNFVKLFVFHRRGSPCDASTSKSGSHFLETVSWRSRLIFTVTDGDIFYRMGSGHFQMSIFSNSNFSDTIRKKIKFYDKILLNSTSIESFNKNRKIS